MACVTSTAWYFRPRPHFGAEARRWNSQLILPAPPDFVHEMCRGLTFFDLFSKSKLPVGARVGLDLILRSHRRPRQGDDNGTGKCEFGVWFSAPPLWRSA
jgi:hypothetical protein